MEEIQHPLHQQIRQTLYRLEQHPCPRWRLEGDIETVGGQSPKEN
jgi:hypothetical protein